MGLSAWDSHVQYRNIQVHLTARNKLLRLHEPLPGTYRCLMKQILDVQVAPLTACQQQSTTAGLFVVPEATHSGDDSCEVASLQHLCMDAAQRRLQPITVCSALQVRRQPVLHETHLSFDRSRECADVTVARCGGHRMQMTGMSMQVADLLTPAADQLRHAALKYLASNLAAAVAADVDGLTSLPLPCLLGLLAHAALVRPCSTITVLCHPPTCISAIAALSACSRSANL